MTNVEQAENVEPDMAASEGFGGELSRKLDAL